MSKTGKIGKLTLAIATTLAMSVQALAIPYAYAPLPDGFTATALNSAGQIAGRQQLPPEGRPAVPALYDNGAVATQGLPPPFSDDVPAINDAGDFLSRRAYRFGGVTAVLDGVATPVATPPFYGGAFANGLNNRQQVVGSGTVLNFDATGSPVSSARRGYVSANGSFAYVDAPGASGTDVTGINGRGQVVGTFTVAGSGATQGFLFDGGVYSVVSRPGALSTFPVAINDDGLIAGTYRDATGTGGFVGQPGAFTGLAGPDGRAFLPVGLNNLGQLIGAFAGSAQSYLATPQAGPQSQAVPEPATFALLGCALLAAGLGRRARA